MAKILTFAWLQNFERATGSDPEAINLRHIFLRSCISGPSYDSWIALSSSDKCNCEAAKIKLTAVFDRKRVPFSGLSSPDSHNSSSSSKTRRSRRTSNSRRVIKNWHPSLSDNFVQEFADICGSFPASQSATASSIAQRWIWRWNL